MWHLKIEQNKIKQKHTKLIEKEIKFMLIRGRGGGTGNWRKVVRRHKLTATRDVMYNVITIITLLHDI